MALVQWHSLPPPSEEEVKEEEPFRFENQNPNEIAYEQEKNHSLLHRFISHLNCILFNIEDYSWKELSERWNSNDPLPRSKNELFVRVATWNELWELSADSNFKWNEPTNHKKELPDCRGRPASMYTLKHVNYAANLAKDPIHNWGLIEEPSELIGMDGRRLPPYISWACCGRPYDVKNPEKNGCWIHTKQYEVIPYNVAPKFTSAIWEQYYADPRSDTIDQTWEGVDEIQKGTMWLPKEHYESLHQQISSLKMKMLPIIKKMFANEYREMQDTNGDHFLDPYETLTANELTTWNQFISLIKEYNKIQCISPSWDLLHVATGTMTWTKEKFEGILMADGSRYVVFKDKKFKKFEELNKEIEDFLDNVFDDIVNPDNDLPDSLNEIILTLAKIDILNDSVIRSQGSLNTLKGEKEDLTNQKFKDFFSERVSKLQQVEPINVDDVASQLKVDITKQSHEDIDTLKQTLDDEIVTKDKNNNILFNRITGIRDNILEPLKEIQDKSVNDLIADIGDSLLVIPKNPATFQEPLGPESNQQKEQYDKLVEKVTPDEEFLQVWLANLKVGNIDEPWLQTRIDALEKAQEELNKFLGEPTTKLQEKETIRRASEREKTEINDVITKSSAIEFSSAAKKILLDHLEFETKQKLTKVLSDVKLLEESDKDLVQLLLGKIQNVLENVPDTNTLKKPTLDDLKKQLDAELLNIENTLSQTLLERITSTAEKNVRDKKDPLTYNITKVNLDQLITNLSKKIYKVRSGVLDKALWIERLAIEEKFNLTEKVYENTRKKVQKDIEERLKQYEWLESDDENKFISDETMKKIHQMVQNKKFPKELIPKSTFYRDDLKGWRQKITEKDDSYHYLYIHSEDIQYELFNNWKYFITKLVLYPDIRLEIDDELIEINKIIDPDKIIVEFAKKAINRDKNPIQQMIKQRDKALSTSAFKWKDNSCWIDSVFTALFALPEMPIENAIRKTSKVNVPTFALVKGSQTESLGSKCEKWQEFHNLVMEDIEFLQKDRPAVPETCKSITMFNDCVEKPQKYGDSNFAEQTLSNLIKFYGLPETIISNDINKNPLVGYIKDPPDNFVTNTDYVVFAHILTTGRHFTTIVKDPINGLWFFYDMDFVLQITKLDENGLPAISTTSDTVLYYQERWIDKVRKVYNISETTPGDFDQTKESDNYTKKFEPYILFYVKKSIWEGLQKKAKPLVGDESPFEKAKDLLGVKEFKHSDDDINRGVELTKLEEEYKTVLSTNLVSAQTLLNTYRGSKKDEFEQLINNRQQYVIKVGNEIQQRRVKSDDDVVTLSAYITELSRLKLDDPIFETQFKKIDSGFQNATWENSTSVIEKHKELKTLLSNLNEQWTSKMKQVIVVGTVKYLPKAVESTKGDENLLDQVKQIKNIDNPSTDEDLIHLWATGLTNDDLKGDPIRKIPEMFKEFKTNEEFLKGYFSTKTSDDDILHGAFVASFVEKDEQKKLVYQWISGR